MTILTLESIQFNHFLKLILLEHKLLLACFGFVARQTWIVSRKINVRKRLNLIDSGVKIGLGTLAGSHGSEHGVRRASGELDVPHESAAAHLPRRRDGRAHVRLHGAPPPLHPTPHFWGDKV
jgi:hypothetical protein